MLKTLQNGQTVLTSGGIIGTIMAVNDDTLILRIKPDNLKIQVARSSVTSLVGTDDVAKAKVEPLCQRGLMVAGPICWFKFAGFNDPAPHERT